MYMLLAMGVCLLSTVYIEMAGHVRGSWMIGIAASCLAKVGRKS